MKKLILTLLSALAVVAGFAQERPEEYHVRVTKADGTVFEGYNETRFSNHLRPYLTKVKISPEFQGEPVVYTSDEVKRVEFTTLPEDSIPVIFEAVIPQTTMPHYFNKNPEPYEKPVFLRVVYDGENVKGYAMPYTDHTMVPSMTTINYTWRYYYLVKGQSIAKAYWTDTDGIVPNMKKAMKFYFREFPELMEMVNSGEVTPKMFKKNPTIVLPLMDRTVRNVYDVKTEDNN